MQASIKCPSFKKIILVQHRRDYGFLGIPLQQAVSKARNAPPPPPTSSSSSDRSYTTGSLQSTTTTTVINPITAAPPVTQVRQPQITPRIAYEHYTYYDYYSYFLLS